MDAKFMDVKTGEARIGAKVKVTPATGEGFEGYLRGVHEGGATIWMDPDAKDAGEVRTVVGGECELVNEPEPVMVVEETEPSQAAEPEPLS